MNQYPPYLIVQSSRSPKEVFLFSIAGAFPNLISSVDRSETCAQDLCQCEVFLARTIMERLRDYNPRFRQDSGFDRSRQYNRRGFSLRPIPPRTTTEEVTTTTTNPITTSSTESISTDDLATFVSTGTVGSTTLRYTTRDRQGIDQLHRKRLSASLRIRDGVD